MIDSAMRGFFHAAAADYLFADPRLIEARFGQTLEATYPEAGPAFLSLARTYWTLQVYTTDSSFNRDESVAHALLDRVERTIGSLFFPMPGPVTFSPDERERFSVRSSLPRTP